MHNGKAQLKWARKRVTEFDLLNRPRSTKFPFAGVATPGLRSQTCWATLARNGLSPFSAVAQGYAATI